MLTISLIGKESNRLDEVAAGLVGTLDDTLLEYGDPGQNAWQTLVVPALETFSSREVAERTGLDTRTIQRIKTRAISKSHDHNRAVLMFITAQHAAEQIEGWGVDPPAEPLECIAYYLEYRKQHRSVPQCAECKADLASTQRRYCSLACKKRAYRRRQAMRQPRTKCLQPDARRRPLGRAR